MIRNSHQRRVLITNIKLIVFVDRKWLSTLVVCGSLYGYLDNVSLDMIERVGFLWVPTSLLDVIYKSCHEMCEDYNGSPFPTTFKNPIHYGGLHIHIWYCLSCYFLQVVKWLMISITSVLFGCFFETIKPKVCKGNKIYVM